MQEVGRMRVDLANMARMAATACLEVGTISRTGKIRYLKMLYNVYVGLDQLCSR